MSLSPAERRTALIIAAVQFVNVLGFMMVMPLGPDLALALGIPASQIGVIGGSYSVAAAVAGLLGAPFLDRFDRRVALAVALGGLVLATALGGLAVDSVSLIATRVLAGGFSGPAVALGAAIVADAVPAERRGAAMGIVMGAFSLAAVLGVPVALELARIGGWCAPFFAMAAFGLVVAVAAIMVLPPQRAHLGQGAGPTAGEKLGLLLARRTVWLAYATAGLGVIQGFMIIPNLATYLQFNLDFPRPQLGLLYLIGGTLSFVAMNGGGRLVDRFGATPVVLVNTIGITTLLWLGFGEGGSVVPAMVMFPLFMLFNSTRQVANSATFTKVPAPQDRAGFMAVVSAVQHLSAGTGAFLSAWMLETATDGRLLHVEGLALAAIAVGIAVPFLMHRLERDIAPAPAPSPAPLAGGL